MSRRTNRPGRITTAPIDDDPDAELPSVRARRPFMFWMMVLAATAMVLSLVALPLAAILS